MQLPGVTDVARAKEIIRSTALLELKLVEQGPFSDEDAAQAALGNNVPPDMQILPGTIEAGARASRPARATTCVRRVPAVTGRDLRNARPTLDENNRPAVSFSLNQEGAAQVRRLHAEQHRPPARHRPRQPRPVGAGDPIAHRRRGPHHRQLHAPGSAGPGLKLRSGALPANLTYLEERTVGPSLGADSVRAGITASIGGLVLVMIFMLFYYSLAGLNAIIVGASST